MSKKFNAATADQATSIHAQAREFVMENEVYSSNRITAISAVSEYIANQQGLTMFYYKAPNPNASKE